MTLSRTVTLSAVLLAVLGGLLYSYQPSIGGIQDMNVYAGIAQKVTDFKAHGGELTSEYPPLTSSLFYAIGSAARMFNASFATTWSWFLMAILLIAMISSHLYGQRKDVVFLLGALCISTLLLGRELLFARFDILVAILLFYSMRNFDRKNAFWSFFFLTTAAFIKLVPGLLFPLLLFGTKRSQWKNALGGTVAGVITALIPSLVLLSPSGFGKNITHLLSYHGERGIQIESTWSGLQMLWRNLHGLQTEIVFKAMSAQNAAFSSLAVQLSLLAVIAAVIGIAFYTQKKSPAVHSMRQEVFLASLAAILALSPVLSPQFIVWLLPLAWAWYLEKAYAQKENPLRHSTLPLLLLIIGLATHWVFPTHYGELLGQKTLSVMAILCVRNIALFACALLLLRPYSSSINSRLTPLLTKMLRPTHNIAIGIAILLCAWGFMRTQLTLHTSHVQYAFNEQTLQQGEMPLFVPTEGEDMRVFFNLTLSPIHASTLRVKPDDCLEALIINNTRVASDQSVFCDYGNGRPLDLSNYLQSGVNTIEARIRDTGGLGGISISLDRADSIVLFTDVLLLVALASIGVFVAWKKGRAWKAPILIGTGGALLRVLYVLVTHYNTRGHDTDAHIDYIQYVAKHFAIPAASGGWEFHQPPLYYFITGTWYAIGSFFGRVEAALLQDVVLFSVLCSFVTLALCIAIAQITFPTQQQKFYRYSFATLLAVWPSLIFVTSRISNDVLYQPLVFGMIALLLLWWKKGGMKYWYGACLLFVLAFLTKVSVAAFAPVFLICFFAQPRHTWSSKITHALLSGTCIILLTAWLPAYRYFAEQDSTKTFTLGNQGMAAALETENTVENLLTFNPIGILRTPYNNPWDNNNRRYQFPEYLYRSAFFGEFGFKEPMNILSIPLLFLGFILLLYVVVGMVMECIRRSPQTLPYLLILFALLASSIAYRLKFPYTSNQDFRFITAAIIPLAYFAIIGSNYCKKYIPYSNVVLYLVSGLSAAFFVLLYLIGG